MKPPPIYKVLSSLQKPILSVFIALTCFVSSQTYAQSVRDLIQRDTLCNVYKLDNAQLEYIYKNRKLKDSTWFLNKKVASFPYYRFNQSKLPDGCYIKTEVSKHKLQMQLIVNYPFEVKNKTIKGQHLLYIMNKKDNGSIIDANVFLNKRDCKYDAGFGAYRLNILGKSKAEKNKYVRIQYKGNDYYYYLNGIKNYIPKPSRNRPSRSGARLSPGYFILSQPKYRPLDTVKYKAYLVNSFNGKPIRRKIRLTLKDNKKTYWSKKIKRSSLGAYHGQFVLPDSLKIDKNYQLHINYYKRGFNHYSQKKFKLEDYKLDKNEYKLIIPKDTFYAGEPLAFYGKATDANGFSLSDTRIKVKISVEKVFRTYQDTIIFRGNEQANWYQLDTIMNELEPTKIIIPKHKLINGLVKYKAVVEMQDVRQEKKKFTRYFYREAKKENTLFYQQLDTLVARQTYMLRDTSKTFDLFIYQNSKLLDSIRIKTPFKKQIAYNYTLAELRETIHDQRYVVQIKQSLLNLIKLRTSRTHDSVQINLSYLLPSPLHYKIYKADNEVASGSGSKIEFNVKDESDDDYYLLISANINGNLYNNYHYFKISQDKKKLRISTDFPKDIYPGTEHIVHIGVTDYKGQAKSKVNLASYAVSSMFKDAIQKPYIHIPKKRNLQLKKIQLEKPEVEYKIKNLRLKQSFRLKDWMVNEFKLHKNDYYKIHYSLQDVYTHYIPLESKKKARHKSNYCELAVLPIIENSITKPSYVRLNGELIYQNNIDANLPYSSAVQPGVYTIDFRYQDKLFQVKNVRIKLNSKTLLCVRLDSILERKSSPYIIQDSLPIFSMTNNELKELDENSLFIYGLYFDTLKVYPLNNENNVRYYFGKRELNNIQVRDESFDVIGLPKHKVTEKQFVLDMGKRKKIISNNKNQVCYIYDKKEEYKGYDSTSTPLFGAGRNRVNYQTLLDISNSIILPVIETEEKKVATPNYKNTVSAPSKTTYRSPVANYTPKQIRGNWVNFNISTSDSMRLAALWIINKNNPSQSAYYQRNRARTTNLTYYGGADLYDIYFLFDNKQYTILKNHRLSKVERWHVNITYFNTLPIQEGTLTDPILLYNQLTKTPMLPFISYPDERDVQVKVLKKEKRNAAVIQGILQNSFGKIQRNTDIYLEKNGRFYRGATTNAKGEFEFLNIAKGDYMLKVFASSFRPRYAYNISIKENAVYTYTIALKYKNAFVPDMIVNENEVQLQVFQLEGERKIRSFANIYDMDTRAPIAGAKITYIRKDGKELARYVSNRTGQFKIYSEAFVDSAYHILFEKEGYRTLKLKNVEFYNSNANQLNIFLSTRSNTKNLPIVIDLQLDEKTVVKKDNPRKQSPYRKVINTKTSYKKSNSANISGRIVDEKGQAIPFASIGVYKDGVLKNQAKTNFKGIYKTQYLAPGIYSLKIRSVGSQKLEIQGIVVRQNRTAIKNIVLNRSTRKLQTVKIMSAPRMVDKESALTYSASAQRVDNIAGNDVLKGLSIISGVDNGGSIAGGRSEETLYMVDGIPIRGGAGISNIPTSLVRGIEVFKSGVPANQGNSSSGVFQLGTGRYSTGVNGKKGYNFFKAAKSKSLRTKFSNLGFWIPNLITNKEGKAVATITFPDDVTRWRTYVLAMGRNYLNDVYTTSIRSYKPIMVNSIIPRFLYLSDKLEAKAKYINLDTADHNVQIKISLNNEEKLNKTINLDRSYVDSVVLEAKTVDSIQWRAELDMDTYYKDGEQISIPVYKDGLDTKDYDLSVLDKDSSFLFDLGSNTKTTIYFNNTVLENILVEIEKLKNYPYACNEQKASKVKGLLVEQQIRKTLKQPFNNKRMLKSLINKLKRSQKANGSWSWWSNGSANNRMTIYIAEVLQEANKNGYSNSAALLAKDYIKKNIKRFSTSDKIYGLYLLKKMNVKVNYDKLMQNISYYDLNTCDKLYYISNENRYKQKLSKARVYDCLSQLTAQSRNRYSGNFFYDPSANMALASKLLKGTSLENNVTKSLGPLIASGKFIANSNTFSKVYLIDAWLENLKNRNVSVNAEIVINDTITVSKFPYVFTSSDSKVKIAHKGTPVWSSFVKDIYLPNPAKRDSLFDVRTRFLNGKNVITELKKGEDVTMEIKVMSFRSTKNIMLEVPIPASCSYHGKALPRGNVSHIEYYKNKAIYYIERLNVGETNIRIPLRVNFSGDFSLPPVNASLMYYPYKSGNNTKSRIKVN